MAVKWLHIFRGGVQRTTPETTEAPAPAAGAFVPGLVVTLVAGVVTAGPGAEGAYHYIIDKPLHGDINASLTTANANGTRDNLRLCMPHSGDMFAVRAAAGIALVHDMPLKINAGGQVEAAAAGDVVFCYVDDPASAHPRTTTPTVANQLIPVKFQ